jgi:S-methylmethionine-dependent homocysteine/selenocysteine methylase
MLPDLNEQLATGFDIPQKVWEMLAKYDVSDITSKIFSDYLAVGLKIDL